MRSVADAATALLILGGCVGLALWAYGVPFWPAPAGLVVQGFGFAAGLTWARRVTRRMNLETVSGQRAPRLNSRKDFNMKAQLHSLARRAGFEVHRLRPGTPEPEARPAPSSPFSTLYPGHSIVELEALSAMAETIPGYLETQAGRFLYTLCYMQDLTGDVAEVGSWQGRSTAFLGHAVKDSGNGRLHAIDHFKGNPGKKQFYIVGRRDLADLKPNFLANMARLGLTETVNLLAMANTEAAPMIPDASLRMLFIDGDHTEAGVRKDVDLFLPKVKPGGMIVFDDAAEDYPGLLKVVTELLDSGRCSRAMVYFRTLVVRV